MTILSVQSFFGWPQSVWVSQKESRWLTATCSHGGYHATFKQPTNKCHATTGHMRVWHLQEVLRHVVDPSQLDCDVMLAGAELAMNTHVRKSTGENPFMLTHGRKALPFNMHLLHDMMAES